MRNLIQKIEELDWEEHPSNCYNNESTFKNRRTKANNKSQHVTWVTVAQL